MAIPDLTNPTKVEARNGRLALTDESQAIVSCAENKTVRVVSLYVANVTGDAYPVTVIVYDGSTTINICTSVAVPANATLSVVTREDPIYLQPGDSLLISTSDTDILQAFCSYEEIL